MEWPGFKDRNFVMRYWEEVGRRVIRLMMADWGIVSNAERTSILAK